MENIKDLKQTHSQAIYKHYFPSWVNGKNQVCFKHDDKKPSLSIFSTNGEFRHHCHACGVSGDCIDIIKAFENTDTSQAIERLKEIAGIDGKDFKKPDRVHVYFGKDGKPLYRKLFFKNGDSKSAYFERYDSGTYIKGLQGIQRTLYNLHLLKGNGLLFVSESEKDADNLTKLGFQATSSGGAESWKPEFAELLQGYEVVITPHNDKAGLKFAETVTKSLAGKAKSIKVIDPSVFGDYKGADISDWIQAGGTKEGLLKLVEDSPEFTEPIESVQAVQSKRLNVSSVSDLLNAEPLTYLVDKILIKNSLTMLSSFAGTGKSLIALLIGKSILTGQKLFETLEVSEIGGVLVIDEENPNSVLKERLTSFGITSDMPLHFLHYQGVKLDSDSVFDELCDVITQFKPKLIIFDSLIRLHSQKENEAGMSLVMERLRQIVNLGVTCLVIHHSRKDSTGDLKAVRGHSDIVGGVDMALTLDQKDDYLLLSCVKSRTRFFEPIRIEFESLDGVFSFKYKGSKIDEIVEAICEVLADYPEGLKQSDILKAISENEIVDCGDKKIRQILEKGEGIYWDFAKGGKTGKAKIYKLKNEMWQYGNTIYIGNIATLEKKIATLEDNNLMQSIDKSKCGNVARGIKNDCHINEIPEFDVEIS